MIGTSAFYRLTVLHFRTSSTALTVPQRFSSQDSGDAGMLAQILHIKNQAELPQMFRALQTFEFRAAAAIWLMQSDKPQYAAEWLMQNIKNVLQMYLSKKAINMLHLLLNTKLLTEEMLESAISLAIEQDDHELYMLLVNHKQEAFGITGETGTFRL
jgi:hypothetical protein